MKKPTLSNTVTFAVLFLQYNYIKLKQCGAILSLKFSYFSLFGCDDKTALACDNKTALAWY